MKQKLLILGAAVVALGVLSGPALAHHGGAAFDQTQTLTFSGTVTQLEFANPHVLVYFDVTKDGFLMLRPLDLPEPQEINVILNWKRELLH